LSRGCVRAGTERDPWKNLLDVLIGEILQASVRGPSGIVFPKHVRDRIRVDLLRLRQQPVGFLRVPGRLLVQAAFGEPARRLIRATRYGRLATNYLATVCLAATRQLAGFRESCCRRK
jgi:hypothetical protein